MSATTLGHVLVVDDEVQLMNALVEALGSQGYQVTGLATGEAALKVMQQQEVDLLLTDLMMPGMDGISLLKAALALDKNLVGIIMTGQGTVPTAVEAMKTGAFDYILKPFRLEAMLPVLARAREVRRLRMENIQLRETVAIYNLSQTIAFSLDSQLVLENTTDAALQQTEADEVSIMLFTPDRQELFVAAVRGKGREHLLGQRVSIQEGIAGWVARQSEPLILNGEVSDSRFTPVRPRAEIHSAISMPMLAAGKMVGVLNVNTLQARHSFTPGQIKALSILTSTASAALENEGLYRALAKREEHFRALIENSADAVTLLNSEGKFLYTSASVQRVLGYAPTELLEQSAFDLIHPDDQGMMLAGFMEALQEPGEAGTTELRVRHKDGSWRWIEGTAQNMLDKPAVQAIVVNFSDISERKQAEGQIKYHARLLRHINDAVIATDDQFRITAWNRAAEKMYGWSNEEVIGRDVSDILGPELTKEQRMEAAKLLRESHVSRGERIYDRKDGQTMYVEENTIVFTDDRGKMTGYVSVHRDVTERKRAEEALRESEETHRLIVQNINEIIYRAAIEDFQFNGTVLFVSPRVKEILGYQPHEFLEDPGLWFRFVHSDDIPSLMKSTQALIASREGGMREYRLRHKVTGEYRWMEDRVVPLFDDRGKLIGFQGVVRDITAEKRAEEVLRQSALQEVQARRVKVIRELILIFALSIGVLVAAFYLNAFERLSAFVLTYRATAVDELVITSIFLVIAFIAFSYRRWQEVKAEIGTRKMGEDALRVLHSELDLRVQQRTAELVKANEALQVEITERKQAQEALQESQMQLSGIFNSAMDAIISTDADERILIFNPAAETMFRYRQAEAIGQPLERFIPERFRVSHKEHLQNFVRSGVSNRSMGHLGNIYGLRSDGKEFPIEASISKINVSGRAIFTVILRDITERKQAEEQIQRQLRHLNALHMIDLAISSSFDLNVVLDIVLQQVILQLEVDACAVLLFNPQLQTIEYAGSRGFRSEALKHTQLRMGEGYASQAVLKRKTVHISELMETGGKLANALQAAGEEFADYYGTPLIVKGEVKGVLEIYHRSRLRADPEWLEFLETLTGQAAIAVDNAELFTGLQLLNARLEQRVAERTAELHHLNLELQQANRAKNEFLANMSHELRTPLNSILGMSESLLEQRRGPLNEHQQQFLQVIHSSGQHLLELINDVLDLSKIEAGRFDYYPQLVEVDALCRSSLAFVKEQANRKAIDLTYEDDQTVSKIQADPRRLKQALVNLLTNAVKFTPEGGQVTLQVRANAEQDLLQLTVIDNGIGISAEDMRKLFQPFVQVDSSLTRQFEGTGLGLALVQKLIDLHGGSISVESEVGKGSRFTINLLWQNERIAQQEAIEARGELSTGEAVEESKPSAEETPARGVILLAEDNMANTITIGEYLESHSYKVVYAYNGLEALEKADEAEPDLILMDIQMPAMDGLEATRRLRANPRFASTPVIALTALAMPGDRERCLEAGATEYMSKPVSLRILLSTIGRLLGHTG